MIERDVIFSWISETSKRLAAAAYENHLLFFFTRRGEFITLQLQPCCIPFLVSPIIFPFSLSSS